MKKLASYCKLQASYVHAPYTQHSTGCHSIDPRTPMPMTMTITIAHTHDHVPAKGSCSSSAWLPHDHVCPCPHAHARMPIPMSIPMPMHLPLLGRSLLARSKTLSQPRGTRLHLAIPMTMHMTMPNHRACLRLLILLLTLIIRSYITHAQLALLSRTITRAQNHCLAGDGFVLSSPSLATVTGPFV